MLYPTFSRGTFHIQSVNVSVKPKTHLDILHYAPNINFGVYLVPC